MRVLLTILAVVALAATISPAEGAPQRPIVLEAGEPHEGTVAAGDASYYVFTVPDRSDVVVTVEGHGGDCELFYYERDATFEDWVTASQGSSLNVEDYFVDGGVTLYFALRDYRDEGEDEAAYVIRATVSYLLDSLGVTMRGEIYDQARMLESGGSYETTLGSDGLRYFRTEVKAGPTLRIRAELPEGAALVWADSRSGNYSGAAGLREGSSAEVTMEDVDAGTECFFYLTADMRTLDPDHRVVIVVDEPGR
jgi:hypothetical protein